jgi:hypothetical protein
MDQKVLSCLGDSWIELAQCGVEWHVYVDTSFSNNKVCIHHLNNSQLLKEDPVESLAYECRCMQPLLTDCKW